MKKTLTTCVSALALAIASMTNAGTAPFFTPLTQSTAVATPNHINELNSPWQVPAGISQTLLTSMAKIEADINQSVVRSPGLSSSASMWDMVAYDPSGDFIFIPHETSFGAGLTRYSVSRDFAEILFSGDGQGAVGNWSNDYGAFDPARFTPYGTVIVAEEWSGTGRVMEVWNPWAPADQINVTEKHSIANVAHEGIIFSKQHPDTMYYIDENNSGSIYKMVASDQTFDKGQTFVLSVYGFAGNPAANYNSSSNAGQPRTGHAQWVPITDADGNHLTQQDPFFNSTQRNAGRIAADEVNGTPYGRPEDTEVGVLANGNEVLYVAATSENAVYSIEILENHKAIVRLFASETVTAKNVGFLPTTGRINSPDNLAQDALGNIYIIEDSPNSGSVGGDVWFVRDMDNDGVAESVDHFMSLQVAGSEGTGMIFNPMKPTEFVMAVQHPASTNLDSVPNGMGDALWVFNLENVTPPTCPKKGHVVGEVDTCSHQVDVNFVEKLKAAGQ